MRIIIAHSQLNTYGGGERATLELLRYLSRRHDVLLWAGAYKPSATFPDFQNFPLDAISPLDWLLRVPNADVVIAHTFGARLLAVRYPRVISYIHTMRSDYLQSAAPPSLALRRAADRLAISRSARVLTNSVFTATRIERFYHRSARVISLGVDPALFSGASRHGSYALYVGRLSPEKGVARLLTWNAGLEFPLRIVGPASQDDLARLRPLAGPKTFFHDPMTGAALWDMYAHARFFVFTPYDEEFGLAALEAMAAAKPVIAVREGALTELIEDGVSGFLVRDATEYHRIAARLIEDDALCARIGAAARQRARAYSWDRFAHQIEVECEATVLRHT